MRINNRVHWIQYYHPIIFWYTESEFTVFKFSRISRSGKSGSAHSVPYFFVRFPWFFPKSANSTAILMFPFYRFNAGFSSKREPYRTNTLTVFHDYNIKNLILMEFVRKARTVPRCVFIWKIIKNRCLSRTVRANSIAVKNEIFSSTDRDFYKNAKIYTTVRLALTLFLGIDLFLDDRGTICAFEINQSKHYNDFNFK